MTQVADQLPIVALHGFTGSRNDFQPIFEKLENFFSLHSLDLPGHGKNKKNKDFGFEETLQWLHQEISKIKKPCVLLGYSLGGRIALQFAVKYPELLRGLVLIGATPGIENLQERKLRKEEDEKLAQRILDIGVSSFIKEWMQKDLIRTQQNIPEPFKTQMLQTRLQNSAEALYLSLKDLGTGNMTPVWRQLQNITCPTLLVTGQHDQKFQAIAEAMLTLIPDSKHSIIPCAGHSAHLENVAYFVKILRNFLAYLLKAEILFK